MTADPNHATRERDRETFGDCDDGCDAPARYLVRDRKAGLEVRVCGTCLASLKGDKS